MFLTLVNKSYLARKEILVLTKSKAWKMSLIRV
jgi:hypothetical protein